MSDRGYIDSISKNPWHVCVSDQYDGGRDLGLPDGSRNELIVEIKDDDVSQHSLIKHEMVHGVTRVISGVRNNNDGRAEFIDEGLALYIANQELTSSGDTWRQWFNDDKDNPLKMINYDDRSVTIDDPSYFDIYPYYQTAVRYFLADDGLGLSESELLDLIADGGNKTDFGAAFDELSLGTTFENLQNNAKARIGDWLDKRTQSRFDLINWNGAEITEVGLLGTNDWGTVDPETVKVKTGTFEANLSFYEDQKMTLIFRSDGTVYEAGSVTLKNGALTQDEYDVSGADPYQG